MSGWAGLLLPVPLVVVGVATAIVGENLRQYGIPLLLAIAALMLRTCLAGPHLLAGGTAGRFERGAYRMMSTGLLAVAAFFGALAVEDLLDNLFGTGRFLSGNETLSALLTLLGSLLALVVLPVGLVAFGVAIAASQRLPGRARWLPLTLPIVIVSGAAAASITGLALLTFVWLSLAGLVCVLLGLAVRSTTTPTLAIVSAITTEEYCS